MGLHKSLAEEPVSELALREPILVSPDEPVAQAVRHMREQRLGCVIVIDADRKPIGLFTESELTRLLLKNPAAVDEPIGEHALGVFVTVLPTDRVSRVLEAMQREDTRFVCVVDPDGSVAGLTGQKGLMEFVADHFPQQVMAPRVGSRPLQQREGA